MTRLPFAPIEALTVAGMDLPQSTGGRGPGWNGNLLADALGVDSSTLGRYRAHGITERTADRLAVHLGLHPAEVWGDAWWEVPVVQCGTEAGYKLHLRNGEPTCAECRQYHADRRNGRLAA